jgi:spore coat polysaccharide biosynthesis protein SpsF
MRKLVACLACRNEGTRLFGKPLQNLDIKNSISILDYMIMAIKTYQSISSIVLAVSESIANSIYKNVAEKHGISYIFGSEEDVLSRLIKACESVNGTDIFRLTTESPFTYFESITEAWKIHVDGNNDLTALDNLPDGSGFEIIRLEAYLKSWEYGSEKHRSELCSLYIRENKDQFKINYIEAPKEICRTDIRLTVDYPEDLVLCRAIYSEFIELSPQIPLQKIINFLDTNPQYKNLVEKYIEDGLKTMYL